MELSEYDPLRVSEELRATGDPLALRAALVLDETRRNLALVREQYATLVLDNRRLISLVKGTHRAIRAMIHTRYRRTIPPDARDRLQDMHRPIKEALGQLDEKNGTWRYRGHTPRRLHAVPLPGDEA